MGWGYDLFYNGGQWLLLPRERLFCNNQVSELWLTIQSFLEGGSMKS
jgi:hypothetical protein